MVLTEEQRAKLSNKELIALANSEDRYTPRVAFLCDGASIYDDFLEDDKVYLWNCDNTLRSLVEDCLKEFPDIAKEVNPNTLEFLTKVQDFSVDEMEKFISLAYQYPDIKVLTYIGYAENKHKDTSYIPFSEMDCYYDYKNEDLYCVNVLGFETGFVLMKDEEERKDILNGIIEEYTIEEPER